MATTSQYVSQPLLEVSQLTAANTNRDGSGTLVTVAAALATAAAAGVGKRINRVTICASVTTTAGVVRFFVSSNSGTDKRLVLEKIIAAVTPSTTIPVVRIECPELAGLVLTGGSTSLLYASTHNAEAMTILVESGTL